MNEHRPRKRFGQNFLHDPGTIRRILAAIAPAPGQRLVEIGPGRGAITRGLLQAAGSLDVIELDRDLIEPLHRDLDTLGELRVHNCDALAFDLGQLAGPDQRLRLIGNLPYNISTPLLFHFIAHLEHIEDMHVMLQREVVERIAADPGDKTYGRLSVMVQTHCEPDILFHIGPGAFQPPPKVESSFLCLRPHRPRRHVVEDPALHARIVAAAFGQRRKTLRNSLSDLITPEHWDASGLDPRQRAENLSVTDFVQLANIACKLATETKNCGI